jgi:hypothetical protein
LPVAVVYPIMNVSQSLSLQSSFSSSTCSAVTNTSSEKSVHAMLKLCTATVCFAMVSAAALEHRFNFGARKICPLCVQNVD